MRISKGLTVTAILAVVSCTRVDPFAFAPWSFPVPAGTTLHGYAPVTAAERTDAPPITLVEELVIGDREGDFDYMFGRTPPRIAVRADGSVAVLDGGNARVQVYDAEGSFVATMGRDGQGPGELRQPLALIAADGALVVWDVVNRRATQWSWSGELLGSRAAESNWGQLIAQVDGGEWVWRNTQRHADRSQDTIFARVRRDGTVVREYARTPWPERVIDPPIGEIVATEPDAWWVGTVPPAFAAAADGTVYASPFDEYQIFAYEADGTMRWALHVAGEGPPISRLEIDYFMEIHASRFPERSASQVAWPERQYALAEIKVDGHGHVYVFPYTPKGTPADRPRPVDVYSAAGEKLYSGTVASRMFTTAYAMYNGPMLEVAWQASENDRVWGLAENLATGNREVVRYRLVEPF